MYPRMPRTRYLDDAPDNASRIKLGAASTLFHLPSNRLPSSCNCRSSLIAAAETSAKAVSPPTSARISSRVVLVAGAAFFIAMASCFAHASRSGILTLAALKARLATSESAEFPGCTTASSNRDNLSSETVCPRATNAACRIVESALLKA